MKTLFLDCGMGAAGDMLTAALLELMPDQADFLQKLNSLGIPGVEFKSEPSVKCGITGTHMHVTFEGTEEDEGMFSPDHEHEHNHEHEHAHDHEHEHGHEHSHHHSSLSDIRAIVSRLDIPSSVKEDVLAVYELIAEAEGHVHGMPVEQVHFHEVGTMDAIADVAAVCLLFDALSPDRIIASPVHVGSGKVRCAHGILPVPAPATAYILRDVPIYGGKIQGELCTPTGAALLKHFVREFGDMPVMRVKSIGYGMGKKDFPAANCVRAILGETEGARDTVFKLECNIDDMTAEMAGYAMERLFSAGALEVYTTPAGMKKSRPGIVINVLCREDNREKLVRELFRHTTTIGIRQTVCDRYLLDRHIETVHTKRGDIRKKVVSGYGVNREKYEYDDLKKLADESGLGLGELLAELNLK